MERATTYITLDVQKIDSGQQIAAKRGDSARRLVVSLTNRGHPYTPGEGVTAVFYARKPDGNPCFNEAQIDGCTVTYDFTGQTTNVVGLAACEIRLYDAGGQLLTSPRFEMLVDATEYQEGDVPDSSPEYTALTEMVSKGTELIADLENVKDGLGPIRDAAVQAAERAEAAAADAEKAATEAKGAAAAAGTQAGQAAKARNEAVAAQGAAVQAALEAAGHSNAALENARSAGAAAEDAATQAETAGNYADEARTALAGISEAIGQHDTSTGAHQDIRLELQKLQGHVTTLLDSDDTTLDQLSEIVAYIKSNRTLIDAITTSKVSVADIVNDLVTNVSDRPLSAAQGVVLKQMLEQVAARIGVSSSDAGALVQVGSDGRLQKLEIGEGLEVVGNQLTATGGGGGGGITAVGDGDDIVISTTLSVRAEGDDIIIGG